MNWEEHETLVRDYIENVLPFLIPNVPGNFMNNSGSGPNSFDFSLSPDAFKGTQYDPGSSRFVHFTSLRSLMSILNENEIRLYNLLNVNDPNEYNYIADEIESNKKFDQIKSTTFILSLCSTDVLKKESSILNLWRFYGDGGFGVIIEFEITVPTYSSICNYFLGKIIYEKIDLAPFKTRNMEFESRNGRTVDFTDLLRVPACFHKSPYFRSEEEFRLMTFNDSAEVRATHQPENLEFKKEYNSRNELVNYHKLRLGSQTFGSHKPEIKIRRIQLGFRHSEDFFVKFRITIEDLIWGKIRSGVWESEMPTIEQSPLKNIYH